MCKTVNRAVARASKVKATDQAAVLDELAV